MGEGEWVKGKGMDSALWVMQGDCRDAAASLPPRPGADGSRFALRLSLCSLGLFAPHVFCSALPSEPNALADAVAA